MYSPSSSLISYNLRLYYIVKTIGLTISIHYTVVILSKMLISNYLLLNSTRRE